MINTVMDALFKLVDDDMTLRGHLGAAGRVKVGWVNESTVFPCVTIYEGSEPSKRRPTYNANKHRDMRPSVIIDTWVDKNHSGFPCNSRDLNTIADYIDELLFKTGVTNTSGWVRTSSIEQQETSVSTTLFHKTRRYDFQYSVTDS